MTLQRGIVRVMSVLMVKDVASVTQQQMMQPLVVKDT